MPTYDYRCELNGEVVEVKHKMTESISTWGELCEMTNRPIGDTPPETPVKKLATGGQVVSSGSLGESAPQCGNGACGMRGSCEYG